MIWWQENHFRWSQRTSYKRLQKAIIAVKTSSQMTVDNSTDCFYHTLPQSLTRPQGMQDMLHTSYFKPQATGFQAFHPCSMPSSIIIPMHFSLLWVTSEICITITLVSSSDKLHYLKKKQTNKRMNTNNICTEGDWHCSWLLLNLNG